MKKYILLAAATISLAACNNDDNYVDEPVAAQISATIDQSTVSRASNVSWDANDAIGITMGDRYINMKYTTSSVNGDFSGTPMYFRNKRDPETITAYYPFTGNQGEVPEVIKASTPVESQTAEKQKEFDFLFAKVENVTGAHPDVELKFSHMMSKLTLIFKNGKGMNVNLIDSYTIEGLKTEGTFNTATGECAATGNTEPLTVTPGAVESGEALPSLLLFPQQIVDKVTLKIHDSEGQDYTCELKFGTDNSLVSGNNYQYTITVNKTGLTVNPSITNWTDVGLEGDAISDDSDDSDDSDESENSEDESES